MADIPSPAEPPPPGEPPPGVTSEVLWRLAARLFTDHRPAAAGETAPSGSAPQASPEARCASCQHSWPCSGRRLAELGLNRATA
jgi:hypothetical protein